MGSCQKYFSIISESSQTHNVLAAGLPLPVKVTLTFLTRKWTSQASWAISSRLRLLKRMDCSLAAVKKKGVVYREVASADTGVWGLGSHSSANMHPPDMILQSTYPVLLPPHLQAKLPHRQPWTLRHSHLKKRFPTPSLLICSAPWQPQTSTKHVYHY